MFHQETLLLAVAFTFCRAYVADKNSLHGPKAVLRLARSLKTADNAIPEPFESYGQQNYKCISEGRFEDPNDCGKYYDCIQTNTGELVAHKKSCFGHGFNTTIKACAQRDMVKGCSPSPTKSLRSFTFADSTLLKVCKDITNEFRCSDCKTLVMCVNSMAYSVPCGQDLLCSSNKTAFPGGVCYPNAPSECTCNKGNVFRKDIYNPSKFLSCDTQGSDPNIHTCPHGSVFNEELRTCGTHAESTCSITGSFAMMGDCNKYYTCILTTTGWLQKDFSCIDSRKMFNDKTGVCEDPCDWYTGDFKCKHEGRFANPGDCKTFYECIKDPSEIGNFTQVEHMCPRGYAWGPMKNRSFCVASSTTTEECVPSKPNNCKIPSGWCSNTTAPDITTAPAMTTTPFITTTLDITTTPDVTTTPDITTTLAITTVTVPADFELFHERVIRRTDSLDTTSDWDTAMGFCNQFGAKPFIPRTVADYALYKTVMAALGAPGSYFMWLPANDRDQEGTLRWYNGELDTNISLWNWDGGHELDYNSESNDCLQYYTYGAYMYPCTDKSYPPICEMI